ncbi:MAG: DUF2723 domain-containing protein [Prevotellaceae bacterium]|jgi:hypothetical protein|nr:DUF2723 domain-containing protein [Prevotellaceae bacterium]
MKNYKTLNNVFGWLSFAIAAFVYLSTIESTASLWDCGEFIVSGYKLEVGHPPGAPLFMMMMRFFTLFAPSSDYVGIMANATSALMSAFTILFLFWSISHLARKLIRKNIVDYKLVNYIVVFSSAIVGALAYTFSDTFWFSAVEAEVYATSSLITAVVFWAILKWEECADEKYANRWLALLAYITGLSIGVHLLNLLAVPAIVFVYYFRKYPVTKWGVVKISVFTVLLLAFSVWGLIPGIPKMASWFELPFVNDLGLPINSGVLFYVLLLVVLLGSSIYYTLSQNKTYYKTAMICIGVLSFMIVWCVVSSFLPWYSILLLALFLAVGWWVITYYFNQKSFAFANTILLCFSMVILGYGSYAMIVIRSSANPPMDQNNPDNIFALIGYLNRDQYGDRPLVSGPYYNAPAIGATDKPTYVRVSNRYELAGTKTDVEFDPRYTTIFPRMPRVAGLSDDKLAVYKSYTTGRSVPGATGEQAIVPTFRDNLRFLFDYQLNYMYWRYFLWNFAGRQNDLQATKGDPTRGNWISGFNFIDEGRIGPQENQPSFLANNKGRNVYYMLPLLLGLLGLGYQLLRDKRNFTVVMLLFFFTGIAIVLYLNQSPNEPRERDYAYAGSFYAFSIWIGLGVIAIYKLLKRFSPSVIASGVATVASFAVPVIMCQQNWDDHNRKGRYVSADFGYNYLNSCNENGIVFVYGDNDTFPLWYNQEVEEVRTDMRVANGMYLSADWYYGQMMRKVYTSERFITTATPDKIAGNRRDQIPVSEQIKEPINAASALNFVMSDDDSRKVGVSTLAGATKLNFFPSKYLTVPISKTQVTLDDSLNLSNTSRTSQSLLITLPNTLIKPHLAIIDIVANNFMLRPIYFGITLPAEYQMGLGTNLQLEGLAYQLVPFDAQQPGKKVNIDKTYDLLMNVFRYRGINNPHVYMDETARRHITFYRRVFFDLGDAMVATGKTDSLRLLLDKYEEVMPTLNDPLSLYGTTQLVKLYMLAGEKEKATNLTEYLCKEITLTIDHYLNLMNKRYNMSSEISVPLITLNNLYITVRQLQDKDLIQIVEKVWTQYNYLMGS